MLLLDTHVVLWLLADDRRLGSRTRARILSSPVVRVSTASLWELTIKAELGKIEIPAQLPDLVEESGLTWLPVSARHAWASRQFVGLPHRDPFDRLLVAQAWSEAMTLLTADRALLGASVEPPVSLDDATR